MDLCTHQSIEEIYKTVDIWIFSEEHFFLVFLIYQIFDQDFDSSKDVTTIK